MPVRAKKLPMISINPISFVLAGLTLFWATPASAKLDLVILPTRIVMDTSQRESEFRVSNVGSVPLALNTEVTEMTMRADGVLEPGRIAEPSGHAAGHFDYSPRKSHLLPGETQVFRLLARSDVPGKELRSHLVIHVTQAAEGATRYKITLPVFVRGAAVRAQVKPLVALAPLPENPSRISATLTLLQAGEASIYGNLTYELVAPNGNRQLVGEKRGFAMYADCKERVVSLVLTLPPAPLEAGSKILATFEDRESGKRTTQLLDLPNAGV